MFEGWLLKINGKIFPNRLIALGTYKTTPNQIMDIDSYRDADGVLHRNVLPHTATSIELSTVNLGLKDAEELNAFLPHDSRVKCQVEYWNPNRSSYESGYFYISDVAYEIAAVSKKSILYKPVKLTITEY